MYIRENKTENRKTGKVYVKHTLVESRRTPKGPRQRTVMQLGHLSVPRKHWPSLATELERRIAGQAEFGQLGLDPIPSVLEAADRAMVHFDERYRQKSTNASNVEQAQYANIDLRTATSSLSRSIGPELVAHAMWEELVTANFIVYHQGHPTWPHLREIFLFGNAPHQHGRSPRGRFWAERSPGPH